MSLKSILSKVTNNSQDEKDSQMTKMDKYLYDEDSQADMSDFSETDEPPEKVPLNEYHSISMPKQTSHEFGNRLVKRRKTQSAFNNNKFSMAVRIDNEKRDK